MDDMQSYFERRRFMQFKTVLDEMRKLDVIGNLRQLGDDLKKENGLSIAQCEYWSDTLDRWADDLVDPACCRHLSGPKSREQFAALDRSGSVADPGRRSQSPRGNTRGRTGAGALSADDYGRQAQQLSKSQDGLKVRVDKVIERIGQLPDAESEFAYEIEPAGQGRRRDGRGNRDPGPAGDRFRGHRRGDRGHRAFAAVRDQPGGGGGGANPGGGGSGKTIDSAMALLGSGVNQKEVREDRGVSQVTGESGNVLPEEFRAGLDEYSTGWNATPAARQPGGN